MSNVVWSEIGDVRCRLLVKDLSGLTNLNLRNILYNLEGSNLGDLAVRFILQLHQLEQLYIGTHALTQVGTTSATRQPNS